MLIRYFFPILMFGISAGLYVMFIDPLYQEVGGQRSQIAQLNEALDNADKIIAKRDELESKIKAISAENLDRLHKILPDHVDNVRLILEIEQLAATHALVLKNADIQGKTGSANDGALGPDMQVYGTIGLGLTLSGSYESFRAFVENFDKALRIADVTSLTLTAGNDAKNVDYQYVLDLKTYWVK